MNNTIVGQGYTIPVCDIIDQIWIDDHPDELVDTMEVPTWQEGLQRIDTRISYARDKIFYFDYPNLNKLMAIYISYIYSF